MLETSFASIGDDILAYFCSRSDGVLFLLLLLKATRQAVFLGRKKVVKFDLIEKFEEKTIFRYFISLFNQLSKPFCINFKKNIIFSQTVLHTACRVTFAIILK